MPRRSEPDISYFELQAYVGTTKHMGGFATTQELLARCPIDKDTAILEIGCGVGATSCYLAQKHGCHVVGVDLRESMIDRANERARDLALTDLVEFRIADATKLPFEDERFDIVFCESVASFIRDKQHVANEFARVSKRGGYVGLNEEIWLNLPPDKIAEQVKFIWDTDLEVVTVKAWRTFLANAGLQDLWIKVYAFDARREATQLKRYRLVDTWLMLWRTLCLYIQSPAFRTYMKTHRKLPKDTFQYLGYALFLGKKSN